MAEAVVFGLGLFAFSLGLYFFGSYSATPGDLPPWQLCLVLEGLFVSVRGFVVATRNYKKLPSATASSDIKNGLGILMVVVIFGLWAFPCIALTTDTVDAERATKRPNVLLVIADDMSWKDWSVYGNKFVKTPHIDKAAEEGVRFSNAYCTSPVCHPSRSALLTGQDIWRLRNAAVFGGTLHNTFDTYPKMLREAGYEVAHSGKGWGPGYTEPGGWKVPPTGKIARLPQLLAAGAGGEGPFCFWWGTTLGHREFNYRPDDRSLETIEMPPYLPDTRTVREDFAGYYQEVEAFDAEVGKVMEMLEKAGLTEETILIITACHGRGVRAVSMTWVHGCR